MESVMSRLSFHTDGNCSEANDCELVTLRAVTLNKEKQREESYHEFPATMRMADVIDELVTDIKSKSRGGGGGGASSADPQIFIVPVSKQKGKLRVFREEEKNMLVKEVDRHRGNVCIVIDVSPAK